MHILQLGAGWSLDRISVAKRGDAHTLCCAVRRNKVGLYATGTSNKLEADGGNGQATGCRELEPSAYATVSRVICSCDDQGRFWTLVGPEIKDASDHGVTGNASGYFVRRGSPGEE